MIITSIELPRGKHTPPEPQSPTTIILAYELAHIDSQRPRPKHRQDLQTDDGQIGSAPPLIRLCVFLPQSGRRTGPVDAPVQPIFMPEEIDTGRGQRGRVRVVGGVGDDGGVGEEAVVEEGAFEEEVDQRVE